MRIALLTLGTRGDVEPFVALGVALLRRGHDVVLCTCERFRPFIESHGLEYGFVDNALLDFIESDRVRTMTEQGKSGPLPWIRALIELMPQVKDMQRDMLRAHWEAAKGAELVIHHPKALSGPHIAEALQAPSAVAPPYPAHVPTGEFPLFMFPRLPLGATYNLATYKFAQVGSTAVRGLLNEFRRETLGLPEQGFMEGDWRMWRERRIPVVHPISPHVLPAPRDWPDHAILSGYWFLDAGSGNAGHTEGDWKPPPDLLSFLAAGPPPIYIGFGSMSGKDPERRTRTVLGAVERAGIRAILATGWGGMAAESRTDHVRVVDEAPHSWLLPRCAAVVHHGGAGTTAAGLRAGRPTLVCPFFVDQPFWAERVRRLGVGPSPIPQKELEPDRLAAALTELVNDRTAATRADELGRKIRAEDGIGVAIEFLRRHGCGDL